MHTSPVGEAKPQIHTGQAWLSVPSNTEYELWVVIRCSLGESVRTGSCMLVVSQFVG